MTQVSKIENSNWYQALIEECKAIVVETEFTARWALVEGYHHLGKRILEENDNFERQKIYGQEITKHVSESLGKGKRVVEKSVQFAKKYPNLDEVPGGKSLTIRKVFNELLPEPKQRIDMTRPVNNLDIKHGDFRTAAIKENSIDFIISDLPYPKEYIELYGDLAKKAEQWLKPSGFIALYSGELNLPEVFEQLNKSELKYYWTFCLYHEGQTQLVMPRNVICRWKPVLIYQKPPFTKLEEVRQDYIISKQREKDGHEWQQSESGSQSLIEAFSEEGDTVLDPTCGAGTFVKVAEHLNRKGIGYEIDKETYERAIRRD